MTQHQLDRAVARATGESVEFIRKRGFGILVIPRRPFFPRSGTQAKTRQARRVAQRIHQICEAA